MLDPGVQAPTGDPGQVAAAASWHERLAGFMDQSAAQVECTAGSLYNANWTGLAATSYAQLATLVVAHFRQAGSVARSAAQSLRRYAAELERLQREGMQAVQQTVHWMQTLQRDRLKLSDAQHAVASAQAAVNSAAAALNRSASIPTPGGAVAAMARELNAAQARLTQAQTAERQAQKAVDDDQQQVQHWQQRARQVWQEAQNEAAVVTGSLEPLAVAPPPLAGAPATFTDALAADAPFLASHLQLSQALAQQIAQDNASRNHLGSSAVNTDERHVLAALEHGQNLDGVPLSVPHHSGGGFWTDLAAVAAVGVTEFVGGGPEDPAADAASAAEVAAIEGGGAAAAAASAGSEAATAAESAAAAAEGTTVSSDLAGARVFRIYGQDPGALVEGATLPDGSSITEGARAMGRSWTREDPGAMSDPRARLGLPNANRGRFVIEGRIKDPSGIRVEPNGARPADGQPGGGDELVVPDPSSQIEILRVRGVNPPF